MKSFCQLATIAVALLSSLPLRGSLEAQAGAGTISAPISAVGYTVTFTPATARARQIRVSMAFTVGGSAPVLLSLPAWTPGSYEISNFSRNVLGFGAEQGGVVLRWEKSDHDTWRVYPGGVGQVTVSFAYVADSLDNAESWTKPDFAFFNGTNLLFYPEGRTFAFESSVTVVTDASWQIATGMTATGQRSFSAPNYHDLVDMPFFVGRFDLDSAEVSASWIRFATYPSGSVSGDVRSGVWSSLKKFIPPQVRVFGEVPWRTYTVLQIVDPEYGGGSGLEHQNSHVDIVSPSLAAAGTSLTSLYAHEVFHAWNVKRLRPAEMYPYRYDQPQPTTLLWMSEGITDYYADLSMVRSGLLDAAAFYNTTHAKIGEIADVPPIALEDASLSTWVQPRDGTGYVYYAKGSLAGLLIDILIRDASDNRRSLDDVMRDLYVSAYKNDRGFTTEEFWSSVSRAAGGKSFADFSARYIDGREPFPWDAVLPLAGMRLRRDTLREPRVGVSTVRDSAGVRVFEVPPGSAAEEAGLLAGDYLIAVGELSTSDVQYAQKLRARYAGSPEGSPVPLRIRRAGREQMLSGRLRFSTRVETTLGEMPRASPKARRVREGLLRGTTRP